MELVVGFVPEVAAAVLVLLNVAEADVGGTVGLSLILADNVA